jgi:hypothetical protein
MHAVLITFTTEATLDELAGPFTDYAHSLCSMDGLVSKTWIHDGNTLGGFHVFASRAAADAYLGSDMAAELIANPALSDFVIDHYEIIDELSAITGSPQIPLAA